MDSKSFLTYKTKIENIRNKSNYLIESNESQSEEKTEKDMIQKELNKMTIVEQVGFSSLPEQVHRKSIKKGFEFTLLVVGDSGLGKSTLVNSLFMTDLYSEKDCENRVRKTLSITSKTVELEEKGVRLKLTVVDTPGFGDSINNQDSWKLIENYIDQQFHSYYIHESGYGIDRKKLQDTRVHCCLYFIPPYVRGLRPIDVETMKSLQTRVNIVPIIGKADSLTKKELELLKQNIMNDIEKYNVKIYEFPICDSDDDESFKKLDEDIKNSIPFGVIGSNTVIESGNKRIRGRVYPWGIIDIESDSCDFNKLRTFLCSSHMQDLKDLTHDVHYESYRTEYIKSQKLNIMNQNISSTSLVRGFNTTDENTDKLLQQKEIELKNMKELIEKMKQNINTNIMNTTNQTNLHNTQKHTNEKINGNNINQVHQSHQQPNITVLTSFGIKNTKQNFISSNYTLNRINASLNGHNEYSNSNGHTNGNYNSLKISNMTNSTAI